MVFHYLILMIWWWHIMGKRSRTRKIKRNISQEDLIKQLFIKSEEITDRELFNNAKKFYNVSSFEEHTEQEIHTMIVNNIRHTNTSYDSVLHNMKRNKLKTSYPIIKNTVLKLISQKRSEEHTSELQSR